MLLVLVCCVWCLHKLEVKLPEIQGYRFLVRIDTPLSMKELSMGGKQISQWKEKNKVMKKKVQRYAHMYVFEDIYIYATFQFTHDKNIYTCLTIKNIKCKAMLLHFYICIWQTNQTNQTKNKMDSAILSLIPSFLCRFWFKWKLGLSQTAFLIFLEPLQN